jgi:CubicO group peptidase (beta-lactamase class C family)
MNAVLRDYAKLGLLYLQEGRWEGVQIIPSEWVQASVSPDAPHLKPGKRQTAVSPMGYGYQWWIPDDTGIYVAMGIYHQFIYVDPSARMVVAKTSAFRDYGRSYRTVEHLALFRAMAAET